jgi:hypothetical protein
LLYGLAMAPFDRQVSGWLQQPIPWLGSQAVALASGLVATLGGAAIVQLSAEALVSRPLDVGAAYRRTAARLVPVAGTAFISFAMIFLSFTILAIPFVIYRLVGWSVALPAIMLEGHSVRAALTRSSQLVGGQRWRVLGSLFVLFVVIVIPALLLQWRAPAFSDAVADRTVLGNLPAWSLRYLASVVVGALVGSFVGSLTWIGIAIIFYKLREGQATGSGVVARIERGPERRPESLTIQFTPKELSILVAALESEESAAERSTDAAVRTRPDAAPQTRPDLAWRLLQVARSRAGERIVALSWEDWDVCLDLLEQHATRQPSPSPELLAAQAKIEDALVGSE